MNPPQNASTQKRQKRSYTTAFKKEVIAYYDEHKSTASFLSVANHFNIPKATVKAFYRRRDVIMKTGDKKKRLRPSQFPELEQDLIKFVNIARSMKLPVTGGLLVQKAKMLRSKHDISEKNFKVSHGWLQRFLERSNIGKSVRLYGQAGSVNINAVRNDMILFCKRITQYQPEYIYNEDESGFLYQLLPNITYLSPYEDRKEVRGIKAMKEKNRLTYCVCTNATGSHILPLFVVGKSANPRAFAFATKEDDVKRCYRSQSNSWMTGHLFDYYIRNIWYPEVRKRTSENVCLIIDNCSAHGSALPKLNGVEYIPLPANVTSMYQPMDQGIINALKTHARANLLSQIVETMNNRDELRALGYKQMEGMRGFRFAHAAHVLDAIQILNRSIKKITADTIVNCWIHSKILSSEQIKKCCNSIGQAIPDFSKFKKTPGLEAESTLPVGTYCSEEMEEDKDNSDEELSNLPVESGHNCSSELSEELLSEAEHITELVLSLNVDNDENSSSRTKTMDTVVSWLQELNIQEENVGKRTDRDPSKLLQYLNEVEEQEAELQQREEEKKKRAEEEKELASSMPAKKERYRSACETVTWLENVLEEAEKRGVSDTVRAHLINTLRSAICERNIWAPEKRQKTIVDFFRP